MHSNQDYYAKDGKVPYQMYYPGVKGVWPLHRWRLLWIWFFDLFRRGGYAHFKKYEEWGLGHHLPCIVRAGGGSTRYAVPVEANKCRIFYFYTSSARSWLGRLYARIRFRLVREPMVYHFSGQDNDAATPCRYWSPEYLLPTDAQVVLLRKLVVEQSRDALRNREVDVDTVRFRTAG